MLNLFLKLLRIFWSHPQSHEIIQENPLDLEFWRQGSRGRLGRGYYIGGGEGLPANLFNYPNFDFFNLL